MELRAVMVSEQVHKELSLLKVKLQLKSLSEVIEKLLGGEC